MVADKTLLGLVAAFTGIVLASIVGGILALIGLGEWKILVFFLVGLVVGFVSVETLSSIMKNKFFREAPTSDSGTRRDYGSP